MAKKKKKQKKEEYRLRYESMGEFLNPETALAQSAMLLDEAAFRAIELQDTEAMAGVSRGWMELGAVLHNISIASEEEEEEDEHDVSSETRIMGFQKAETREVLENAYKS